MKLNLEDYIKKNPKHCNGRILWINISSKFFGETFREDLEIDLNVLSPEISQVIIESDENLYNFPCCDVFIISVNRNIDIDTSVGRLFISGDNNSIRTLHENDLTLMGNYNKLFFDRGSLKILGGKNYIRIRDTARISKIEGKQNKVKMAGYSSLFLNTTAQDTFVSTSEYSTIINFGINSKFYLFGSSVCHSISNADIHSFGKSTVINFEKVKGREACRELADENSGYFYKVVDKNLYSSFYWGEHYKYEVGEWHHCENFDESPKVCSGGFHFFSTVEEAVSYAVAGDNIEDFVILRLLVNFDDIAETDNEESIDLKFRARNVFVDSIVPEEQYKELVDNMRA